MFDIQVKVKSIKGKMYITAISHEVFVIDGKNNQILVIEFYEEIIK